ncbi:MAG: GNAT family N-acetyltransferase [Mariniblastus sp.]
MDSIPRLETERLKLRAVFPSDTQSIFEIYSDPLVAKFYDFEPYQSLVQTRDLINRFTSWFQHDQAVRWAMIRKDTDQLIGTCCFDAFHVSYRSANLGYNMRSDQWGNGFATEGAKAIVDFAFANGLVGPLNRIQAITDPRNAASEQVLMRLGFGKEGLMRQYGFWKGEYHDMHLFSLLKDCRPQ